MKQYYYINDNNEEVIDLILLDLRLPGMSGQDLLRILKKTRNTADIPVVVLSAVEEKEASLECMEEGAEAYVQKPFAKKLLLREIRRCLGEQDSSSALENDNEEGTA